MVLLNVVVLPQYGFICPNLLLNDQIQVIYILFLAEKCLADFSIILDGLFTNIQIFSLT